jgi:hypothetical protein
MVPKSMSDELENFKIKYRATVSEGRRRYTIPKPFKVWDDVNFNEPFEVENGVQIDMSQRDFEHLVHMEKHFYETMNRSGEYVGDHAKMIVKEHEREQRIRAGNPSVRAAYAKYQNLLRLVDSYYD